MKKMAKEALLIVLFGCALYALCMRTTCWGGELVLHNDTSVIMEVHVEWVNHPHGVWVDPRNGRIYTNYPVCGAELEPGESFKIDREIEGEVYLVVWHTKTGHTYKKANGYRIRVTPGTGRAVFRPFSFDFYAGI